MWKNRSVWFRGGIIGVIYLILMIFITFIITFNTGIYHNIKIASSFFYHFVADFFIAGSVFYSSVPLFIYGIFISPLVLYYKIISFINPFNSYLIVLITPLIFFFILGALIGWIVGKIKSKNRII